MSLKTWEKGKLISQGSGSKGNYKFRNSQNFKNSQSYINSNSCWQEVPALWHHLQDLSRLQGCSIRRPHPCWMDFSVILLPVSHLYPYKGFLFHTHINDPFSQVSGSQNLWSLTNALSVVHRCSFSSPQRKLQESKHTTAGALWGFSGRHQIILL